MLSFSIIIPVYRVEQYLDQCVQSVVAQTYREFEVILVDDGSPDNSSALCDRWAEKDSRIRVIHQENQGLSGARNTGIQAASGDYLMFLDSDDWWSGETVLQTVAERLEKTGADVLSFNYQKIYGSKRETPYFGDLADAPENLKGKASLKYMIDKGLWISCAWNKVIRHQITENNELLFRPGISSEDMDWTLRLSLYAQNFDYIGFVAVLYRQRKSSISHTVLPRRVEDMCGNVKECLRLLRNTTPDRAKYLKPFVAFQFATVVYNYAGLSAQHRLPKMKERIVTLLPLLNWSDHAKVKAIRLCVNYLGFSITVWLLRCRQMIQNMYNGETM